MSGIAGWVDRRRDLTRERAAGAAMTARMTARGMYGERLWTDREVLLGHRAGSAATVGAQPYVLTEGGRTVAAITFDGVLDNAAQLAARLPGCEGRPAGGDPEVVLRAWLEWGSGAAGQLDGTFAFAVWDARGSELVLCRDRFGTRPLSFLTLPQGVLFASEAAALCAHPLVRPELDAEGLCALLSQVRSPGRGVLGGIHEIRPAHLMRFRPGGVSEERYWSLTAAPHSDDLPTTIATARELLGEAIDRASGGDRPGVLLSGGLDSSTLTGLVAERAHGAPRTFTVAFGDRAAAVPDRPYAEAVVDLLGCDHTEVLVAPDQLSDPLATAAVLAAKDNPSPFGDKNLTPYLFYRQVAAQSPVVLSGEAADAVFGGLITEDERQSTRDETFPWIERARAFGIPHGIGTGLFDGGLLREIGLSAFCADRYQEARAEVAHLPGAGEADRRAREIDHLHLTRLYEQAVNHSERLGSAAGLDIRFPFADHRLVGYLYNVPWRMKSFDGHDKSLLRAIAKDLVPASVLERRKVPFPITYDTGYKEFLTGRLRQVLEDPAAPVLPLLDLPAAWRMVDDPRLMDRGGWLGRADAEMVLQTDDWLRDRQVRLAL
ncbi:MULTISPECIES: asparagine synthase (glutamine-hydrolyzing) [unclassified Streptomyces]|jgi:asparagine synthase (glutamine-hydrolyzing)|uniref:asparagine synthase (glutamine-hydrolyzing) n=1 Tax=unclassified Streptomyces TaxID=2593676 RepID=UPI002E25892F